MRKVTLVEGDGIGPEITQSVQHILEAAGAQIEWDAHEIGLTTYEKTGTLIPQEFIDSLENNGVALKGPTTTPVGGGHRSINVSMRQLFKLYANVRPIKTIKGLPSRYENVDMIIVRENSEDLYKGIEYKVSEGVAQGIKLITAEASERIGRHAFELAQKLGRKKVTVVHKANIMKFTDGLFLESVRKVAANYTGIELDELIVDNCCMQMVTKPEQFDVIVTENLYGDILSDLAAGLIGGLGLASGANIGQKQAIFEAAHGSAPDIAGKDLANPTALLMSATAMLDHINQSDVAARIESALKKTLANPETRTKDLGGTLGCKGFTEAIISNL
ncbi:isocitrate/isopropylmalate dehydrogenase family protein [Pseudobacteriovorax antillogorgiicola]|uniref:Isocitrate dehydrogenase (NAD+) n=1 Tax=Pseudobacteriovorax antillogorgiicola TaxID=1513793 RepID=A0A1Y6B8C3_9BACT|nr:isocitrate/isopropylmalate dehydrogenase family protein [Pseudobacteriovorax antillogorgiicola]TCS59193.1 isocitrate dehydrogenase (NAD+) [Pseudobacteriovorax antillogorgiicola]SME90705.1 isocitrate dehydrogenase (NAD+) [Pseudobacteriovorax antillogorgiicola]